MTPADLCRWRLRETRQERRRGKALAVWIAAAGFGVDIFADDADGDDADEGDGA